MEGEFNNLTYNNTNITFTGNTNNIETSDELTATLLYQDKMGTKYSKSKGVVRAFNIVGITLIFTAAAFKAGSIFSNIFVTNPPSIVENSFKTALNDHEFSFSFEIENKGKYQVYYFLEVNEEIVLKEDCSTPGSYEGSYDQLKDGDNGKFYIQFTNKVDYKKTIETYKFTVGGN